MTLEELRVIISSETSKLESGIQKAKQALSSLESKAREMGDTVSNAMGAKETIKAIKNTRSYTKQIEELDKQIRVVKADLEEMYQGMSNPKYLDVGAAEAKLENLNNKMAMLKAHQAEVDDANSMKNLSNNAKKAALSISATDKATRKLKSTISGIGKLVNGIGSIFKRMIIRKIIMQILKDLKECIDLLAKFDKASGGMDGTNKALSNITSKFKQLSATISVTLMSVLKIIEPIVTRIASLIVNVMNQLNAAIASFSGKSTYTMVNPDYWKDYSESLDNTSKSAKKALTLISGFDELNTISPKSDSDDEIKPEDMFKTMETESNNLSGMFEGVLEGAREMWDSFMKGLNFDELIQKFKDAFSRIKESWLQFIRGLDFSEWMPALNGFFESLGQLANTVFGVLIEAFELLSNAILEAFGPALSTIVEKTIPGLVEVLGSLLQIVSAVADAVWDIVKDVWEGGIQPVLNLLGQMLNSLLQDLDNFWNKYGKTIIEEIKEAIAIVKEILLDIWHSVFEPVIQWLVENLSDLWESTINPLINNIMEIIGVLIELILALWNNVLGPLVDYIVKVFGPLIGDAIAIIGNVVKQVVEAIGGVINGLLTILKGLLQFLTGVFTGNWSMAWEGIGNIVKGVFDGIWSFIKGIINSIIGLINGMISGIVSGLNVAIRAINSISITVPSWVPGIGGKSIGFNLKTITAPQIPYLAKGGVISNPTVAMLGEYKGAQQNPEIAAPESLLRQIIKDNNGELVSAFAQMTQQVIGAINNVNMEVSIGDDTIAQSASRGNQNYYNMTGKSMFAI